MLTEQIKPKCARGFKSNIPRETGRWKKTFESKEHQRMIVDPRFMIVQSLSCYVILPEFTWIYLNLPEFTWIDLKLPEFNWIYLTLPEFTWNYLK